jgi:hypothetical protein
MKNILAKLTFLIIAFSFVSACYSSAGNKSAILLYKKNNLENGTNIHEISKKYGEFSSGWIDEDGNNLYQYFYTKNKYDLISYLPIINHFGWVKTENYEILLIFDSKHQLISQKKFFNRAKSRNSLVCSPDAYSCIRKVY